MQQTSYHTSFLSKAAGFSAFFIHLHKYAQHIIHLEDELDEQLNLVAKQTWQASQAKGWINQDLIYLKHGTPNKSLRPEKKLLGHNNLDKITKIFSLTAKNLQFLILDRQIRSGLVIVSVFYFQKLVFKNENRNRFSCVFKVRNKISQLKKQTIFYELILRSYILSNTWRASFILPHLPYLSIYWPLHSHLSKSKASCLYPELINHTNHPC